MGLGPNHDPPAPLEVRFAELLERILTQIPEQAPNMADVRYLDPARNPPDRQQNRVVLTKNPIIQMKDLAKKLGMEQISLKRKIDERRRFSLDQIQIILKHVHDPRLAQLLLDGTGYRAAQVMPRDDARSDQKTVEQLAMHIIFHASNLAVEMERAVRDGKITSDERNRISAELVDAESALASLHVMLNPRRSAKG